MLGNKILDLFKLIEPYRIYANVENKFLDTLIIKDDSPANIKEACRKLQKWQKKAINLRNKGIRII